MNRKLIIILILLVAVAFGLTAYLSQKHKEPKTPSISTEEIDVSNWQVYRNEGYGFEIKYPDNFEVKEYFYPKARDAVFCDNLDAVDKEFDQTKAGQGIEEDRIFSFQIHVNPTSKCEQQIISHYSSQLTGQPLPGKYLGSEENVINNKKFIKKNYFEILPELEYRTISMIAYRFSIWEFVIDDRRYTFSYSHKRGSDNSFTENEFKKILSTFKIIDEKI